MYFCSGQPMHFCCGVDTIYIIIVLLVLPTPGVTRLRPQRHRARPPSVAPARLEIDIGERSGAESILYLVDASTTGGTSLFSGS